MHLLALADAAVVPSIFPEAFGMVFVLIMGSWDSPDAEIWGVSVPVWLFGLVVYILGAGAGIAAERARKGR